MAINKKNSGTMKHILRQRDTACKLMNRIVVNGEHTSLRLILESTTNHGGFNGLEQIAAM